MDTKRGHDSSVTKAENNWTRMFLNHSPDLIEVTVPNVLTICIQEKQAAAPPCGHIYKWIVKVSTTLEVDHQGTFVPKYFKIGPVF